MNIECFPPRPGVCSPPGRDDGGYLSENPNVCLRTGLPADRGCPVVRLSSPNHGDASRTRDLPFRTPNCPARTCLFPRTRGLPTYLRWLGAGSPTVVPRTRGSTRESRSIRVVWEFCPECGGLPDVRGEAFCHTPSASPARELPRTSICLYLRCDRPTERRSSPRTRRHTLSVSPAGQNWRPSPSCGVHQL